MNTHHTSWHPESWRDFPVRQMPDYPDQAVFNDVFRQLKAWPPLVTSWEIEALKRRLVKASKGDAFLLQGGDCAESFQECEPGKIVNSLKVLLQMSLVLIHEIRKPVVRVGRLAGQYAKPRSKDTETIDGKEYLAYRGDLYNSHLADEGLRAADPKRLLTGYQTSALTLNFVRALTEGGGFADLHHPEFWELDFMKDNPAYDNYREIVKSITNAISFVESISAEKLVMLKRTHIYTSHEALNLWYESGQTRRVPHQPGFYNLSAHMLWLGNRTRDPKDGHVEYLRGIENPIGIKVGPPYKEEEIIQVINALNPQNKAGKIVLISRMGVNNVEKNLPSLIRTIKREGFDVCWSCDPMHGNTYSTSENIKTRHFDAILKELVTTLNIHGAENSILGGVHLELTGENVTECTGGAIGPDEAGLSANYQSFCDPRLNYEQSMELAFHMAREYNKSFPPKGDERQNRMQALFEHD